MDLSLFQTLNGLAGRWPLLDYLGIFLASWLPYVMALVLALCWFRPKSEKMHNRQAVLVALTSALFARLVIKTAIVMAYNRPRPFEVVAGAKKLIDHTKIHASFPSGHVVFFFALAMGVYFYNKKLGTLLFTGAALMGIARVYTGVHWPTDILAGALVGVLAAWPVRMVFTRIYKDRLVNIVSRLP